MSCIRARHAEGVISWGLHDLFPPKALNLACWVSK